MNLWFQAVAVAGCCYWGRPWCKASLCPDVDIHACACSTHRTGVLPLSPSVLLVVWSWWALIEQHSLVRLCCRPLKHASQPIRRTPSKQGLLEFPFHTAAWLLLPIAWGCVRGNLQYRS